MTRFAPCILLLALTLPLLAQEAREAAAAEKAPPTLEELAEAVGSYVDWRSNEPLQLREGNRQERKALSDSRRRHSGFDRVAKLEAACREATEKNKLVLWYAPRIMGRQMYRPRVLDRYMMAIAFSDPDCVTLINEHFVPVRLACDKKLQEKTGITAPDKVEPALVFLNGKGEIVHLVHSIRSFNALWFRGVLREVLGKGPSANISFAEAPPPAELEQTLAAETDAANQLALRYSIGRAWLAEGKVSEASAHLARVRGGPHHTGALYHLGLCDVLSGDRGLAERRFREVVKVGKRDPKDPFVARAAQNLVLGPDRAPVGPALLGFEAVQAPLPSGELAKTSSLPRTPEKIGEAVAPAVDYLLDHQRQNGGWTDSRYSYWGRGDYTPNVWVANTSLAMTALLEWRDKDPERIDEALKRGERYIFDERHMARGWNEEIYADAYKLLYLTRKHAKIQDPGEKKLLVEQMNRTVRDLMATQKGPGKKGTRAAKAEGFWAHEYPNAFCTAAVMNSLEMARRAGANVPRKMMKDAADGLLTIRDPKTGAYSYSAGRSRFSPPKDSMARSAICEAVILWTGHEQGSEKKVSAALEDFWKFLPRLDKVRKCDFHTDGELAGFFFWHGLFHTTESLKALSPDKRAPQMKKFVEYVAGLGEIDGSFIDSHEMGKSYGTAMGLLTLKNILFPDRP